MSHSWRSLVHIATAQLRVAGVEAASSDALDLASFISGHSRGKLRALMVTGADAVTQDEHTRFSDAVARRCQREPLQHITGRAAFRALDLRVGPGVFVPRPETEYVVEVALGELRVAAQQINADTGLPVSSVLPIDAPQPSTIVDLCTGSGAIALSIAHEVAHAQVWAVELDRDAHSWAKRNLDELPDTVSSRVKLIRGDARTALADLNGHVDLVVSNPPYIPPDAVPRDPEVQNFDPPLALYGLGADGLEVPRGIMAAAARLLRPGGSLVMEHAETQAAAVRALLDQRLWSNVRTEVDLTGRDRMVVAQRSVVDVQSVETMRRIPSEQPVNGTRVEQGMES